MKPVDEINCLKIFINNITKEELDHITDNISNTLTNERGNKLFEEFLNKRPYTDASKCLWLYNKCSQYLTEQNKSNKEQIAEEQVRRLIDEITDMVKNGPFSGPSNKLRLIKQCKNMALPEDTIEALNNKYKEVLEKTKKECQESLLDVHKQFQIYIVQCKNPSTQN